MADRTQIDTIRQVMECAENAGDPEPIVDVLADDVVLIVPDFPVYQGRAAAAAFLREIVPALHGHFVRHVAYKSDDVSVSGDSAIDRGTFSFTVRPRTGGPTGRVTGKYLWMYERRSGSWKGVRMMTTRDEGEGGDTSEENAPPGRWLVRVTAALLAIYVPVETWFSAPALWNPFYLVDLVAMVLLGCGVWTHWRGSTRAGLIWLVAGYGWSGANAWRALFGRVQWLDNGGALRLGTPELVFVVLGTMLSFAGLIWATREALLAAARES